MSIITTVASIWLIFRGELRFFLDSRAARRYLYLQYGIGLLLVWVAWPSGHILEKIGVASPFRVWFYVQQVFLCHLALTIGGRMISLPGALAPFEWHSHGEASPFAIVLSRGLAATAAAALYLVLTAPIATAAATVSPIEWQRLPTLLLSSALVWFGLAQVGNWLAAIIEGDTFRKVVADTALVLLLGGTFLMGITEPNPRIKQVQKHLLSINLLYIGGKLLSPPQGPAVGYVAPLRLDAPLTATGAAAPPPPSESGTPDPLAGRDWLITQFLFMVGSTAVSWRSLVVQITGNQSGAQSGARAGEQQGTDHSVT